MCAHESKQEDLNVLLGIHKRKVRATGVKVLKRIDVSKLQTSEVCEALRNTFDNIDVGGSWEQCKTQLYTVPVDVRGIKKTNHRDWFDEKDASITKFLNEKNKLHEKLLSTGGRASL